MANINTRGVILLEFNLIPFASEIAKKKAIAEILKCNDLTEKYGLVLNEKEALELVEIRTASLKNNGRMEFGAGIIDKLIKEFCDSPYISQRDYQKILQELIDIFYYYKNETMDLISDDDLIKFMKKSFNGVCGGSLELLSGRELHKLAENLRFGFSEDSSEEEEEEDDEE